MSQFRQLQTNSSADPHLVAFTESFLEVTRSLNVSGDIPDIVNLLDAVIDHLTDEPFKGEVPFSYNVSTYISMMLVSMMKSTIKLSSEFSGHSK